MSVTTFNAATNVWHAKPLNRTGDLSRWQRRMQQACPQPARGQVVYLDSTHFDRGEQRSVSLRIGYLCIGFKPNGEPLWQRGMVQEI